MKYLVLNPVTVIPQYNGEKDITGETKDAILGVNVPFCPVYLFDQDRKTLITSMKSDVKGHYVFPNVSKQYTYFVIAHHPDKKTNGEIADNIRFEE